MKKMKISKRLVLLLSICVVCGGVAAAQLKSVIKGGAVALVVGKFGKDINKFINQVSGRHNGGPLQQTKVVPILAVGDSGYIGAVQVSGPDDKVNQVKAVAEIEAQFKPAGVRIKALIPINNLNPSKGISRVEGVGVSAIVDIKL